MKKKSNAAEKGYTVRLSKEAYNAIAISAQRQKRSKANMASFWIMTMFEKEEKLLAMQKELEF